MALILTYHYPLDKFCQPRIRLGASTNQSVRGVRRVLRVRTEKDSESRIGPMGANPEETTTSKQIWLGGRGSFPAALGTS